VLHHGYAGAIHGKTLLKGLRLRTGNMQIGDHSVLEELFPEPRFSAWSVGEVHVVDSRIVPNGRRDNFEQSVHLDNLLNHLSLLAKDIARRCRVSSIRRRCLRDFQLQESFAKDKMKIIAQGGVSKRKRVQIAGDVERTFAAMEKVANSESIVPERPALMSTLKNMRKRLQRLTNGAAPVSQLTRLPAKRREMYEHLFALIYECSTNRTVAQALVDRIMLRII
jgi:hypothetical protein